MPGGPRGGARPGAGRPKGGRNALPLGAVSAIKSANQAAKRRAFAMLAAPETLTQEAADVAVEAEDAILSVMRQDWRVRGSGQRLAAAAAALDRTIGPVPRPMQVSAPDGGPVRVQFSLDTSAADERPALPEGET